MWEGPFQLRCYPPPRIQGFRPLPSFLPGAEGDCPGKGARTVFLERQAVQIPQGLAAKEGQLQVCGGSEVDGEGPEGA